MTTPMDALEQTLRSSAVFQQATEAAPEAVLWCDEPADFIPILPALRARMPQLLTFGDYDPATRTGPALWLRGAAARQVAGASWPGNEPPIIYLPGIAREVLRGAEDCPSELASLVWFAVSGVFVSQTKQCRDLTMRGFLRSQGSPSGLNIPEDRATREALTRAAVRLFTEPFTSLTGKQWDAVALDGLLVEDPISSMLAWMDGGLTQEADPARFESFSTVIQEYFKFDPRKRSRQDAAARLVRREKAWGKVWKQFEQASSGYDGIVKLLSLEEPQQADLLNVPVAYPQENARGEDRLRVALRNVRDLPAEKAAGIVRELEKTHCWRRETVWAKRGEARLAQALMHLAIAASAAPLQAHDAEAMAADYAANGWRTDAAALEALGLVRNGDDREVVVGALRAIYLPWLDGGASALQGLVAADKMKPTQPGKIAAPPAADVILFVDGLRMDLAHQLADCLRLRKATVSVTHRWSGFPTVTATCKALVSPAAHLLTGGSPESMLPTYNGKPVAKPVLVKAIEAAGWSCAAGLLTQQPLWRETGQFDEEGHALGSKLAERVQDALAGVADEVLKLVQQGRHVRIVTDHGWLLMPEGLPYAALAPGLTEPSGKANRVALLKGGAPTTYQRVAWSWDAAVEFVTPPGARTFYNGTEYAHGGISPQECILPVLDVTIEGETKAMAMALSVKWRNLMLKVTVKDGGGLIADVRLGSDTSGPSVLVKGPKTLDDLGEASLGVSTDYEGQEVCVVIHAPDNPQVVLAKRADRVGG